MIACEAQEDDKRRMIGRKVQDDSWRNARMMTAGAIPLWRASLILERFGGIAADLIHILLIILFPKSLLLVLMN